MSPQSACRAVASLGLPAFLSARTSLPTREPLNIDVAGIGSPPGMGMVLRRR